MSASQAFAQQGGPLSANASKNVRALMIEDNTADARLLREILAEAEQIEFRLTVANSLAEGTANLKRGEFDIVLLDLNLPDSQGLDSVSQLLAEHARTPVVVLTGTESDELGLLAVAAGAQDFLTKDQLNRASAVRTIRFAIERFQALSRQQYEAVRETGEKMQDEIGRLAASLDEAGESTGSYRESLGTLAKELNDGLQSGDVANLIERLSAATLEMHRRTASLEDQLKESAETINTLSQDLEVTMLEAITDALTGLFNRKAFDDRLEQAVAVCRDEGTSLSLLMIDIDHFKKFNDTWGHQVGDQVLRLVGQSLRMNVKGKDTAARYGGEEMALILPDTPVENAVVLAEQIRKIIGSMNIVKKKTRENIGPVTVSIGAAQFSPGEAAADLVSRADYALYAAKEAGRNRVTRAT